MSAGREEYVVKVIEAWDRSLSPALFSDKMSVMLQSSWQFFRGTGFLFWSDFGNDVELLKYGSNETRIWISGNCHFESFKSRGDDMEGPSYCIQDFEDSFIADYQLDVWRLAVSLVLLYLQNIEDSVESESSTALVEAFAMCYLKTVIDYRHRKKKAKNLGGGLSLEIACGNVTGSLSRFLGKVERDNTERRFRKKWSNDEGTKFELSHWKGKLQQCPKFESDALIEAFGFYAETALGEDVRENGVIVKDVVRRKSDNADGYGLPRYHVLIDTESGEIGVLDVRLQRKPTGYYFLRLKDQEALRDSFEHDADRWRTAQQMMCPCPDPYAGWIQLHENVHPLAAGFYSVQRISAYEEAFPALRLEERTRFQEFCPMTFEGLVELAENWAQVLGTQHCHAASLMDSDAMVDDQPRFGRAVEEMAGKDEKGFVTLVCQIAETYAEDVQEDWLSFKEHITRKDRRHR